MEGMLKEILKKLDTLQEDISELKDTVIRVEDRQNTVLEQVANLTEFHTEASDKLDKLTKDVEFVVHKGNETEKEVFFLKKKLLSNW